MSERSKLIFNRATVLAVIPARGGSKGIPRKNIRLLAGKPLIVHTIEQAMQSSLVTETVVSTDDQEIASVSKAAGATVVHRPADISGDTASSEKALVHAVQSLMQLGRPLPDLMVFLQCTSPIRKLGDIDAAVSKFLEKGADSLLSVSPSHRFLWTEDAGGATSINYDFLNRPRRQDMSPQYLENGSIYVFRTQALLDSGNRLSGRVALYHMDEEAAVDIDSMLDLKLAELILLERSGGQGVTNSVPRDLKRTLLVVGSGFIAAELALTAQREWGWAVKVLYRNFRNPALESVRNLPLPACPKELVRLLNHINPTDVVIATGSSFVPEINRNVEKALEEHVNGTLKILDALTRLKQPLRGRVLVIGSAAEYGDFSDGPVNEQSPAIPRDHYGLIKLTLRHMGLHFHKAHGLPLIHLRQFNVTGPGQDSRFVLPSICRQINQGAATIGTCRDVRVVAGNTSVRRDFLAIADVCRAYQAVIMHGEPGEVYNICSGQSYQISELILMAAELAGVRAEIEVNTQLLRETDKAQAVICGDPSKLRSLGWVQQVSMSDLLAQMIQESTPLQGVGLLAKK